MKNVDAIVVFVFGMKKAFNLATGFSYSVMYETYCSTFANGPNVPLAEYSGKVAVKIWTSEPV